MVWLRARGTHTTLRLQLLTPCCLTPTRPHSYLPHTGRLSDDPNVHRCVAAYASDFALLRTTMLPHGWPNPFLRVMVSLDHSMWFHTREFRAGE